MNSKNSLLAVYMAVLWESIIGEIVSINSGNSNVAGSGFGNNNVNVISTNGGNVELSASQNNLFCTVQNGQIYVNGRYIRNMQPQDYVSLNQYKQGVAQWSASLNDNIQRSFPWDPRNPQHNEFPWNPAAFPGRRRRQAIPFPNLPSFCFE